MSTLNNVYLNVSELVLSDRPVTVSTVLGSCVSVFVFSKERGVGGVIHYALPNYPSPYRPEEGLRYGDVAIPFLIKELRDRYDVTTTELTAKILGGSFTAGEGQNAAKIGEQNIILARKLLKSFGIPVLSESVGGKAGRKVLFHIPSGRAQVAQIKHTEEVSKEEKPHVSLENKIKEEPKKKIKVLIVDDSKTIRQLLSRILSEDPAFTVLPPADSAIAAAEMIKIYHPDVITLDIHMPGMTGVEWLEKLIPTTPIPVVMISSLQLQEGNEVFRALELGAVDYIQKPSLSELPVVGPAIREKVQAAATAKVVRSLVSPKVQALASRLDTDFGRIIVIGASTGGTEAIKKVIAQMPAKIPPILIVQHIPPGFSLAFAKRLNDLCPFLVKEAEDGDEILPSKVLIAPGGKQMKIQRAANGKLSVRITNDEPVNRHKPSVDYLFNSVAEKIGKSSVGVILTGMGSDGAAGLLRLKNAGAYTIGQDEESSVVYGMPKSAVELGAVTKIVSLDQMAKFILDVVSSTPQRRSAAS